MTMPPTAELLDVKGIADYLGVKPCVIYAARHRGEMAPAIKLGKYLRWRREDVEAWLASKVEAA